MFERVDHVVVGAGVVGLAIARELARSGGETLVLEQHSRPGEETSSRNSGVIHSGIYYAADSLKARLCVRGRELLYAYCRARQVPYRRCGKLIVAQLNQLEELQQLHSRAVRNGVGDLQWLSAAEVSRLEPQVQCAAALLSPSTGIVDVPTLVDTLQADLEAAGGSVVFRNSFTAARRSADGFIVEGRSGSESWSVGATQLINAAGLRAIEVAGRIGGAAAARLPAARFAKGNYFACSGRSPFTHLVYPMPEAAGLGVHATLDLDGRVRFGPDVEWVDAPNYDVAPERANGFYAEIRQYWPALPDAALQPAYAGVRPKLTGPGEPAADFVIETEADHGVPGLVNLLGIESPGLTSSLAIAEYIVSRIGDAR